MASLEDTAKAAAEWFETATRTDDSSYTKTKDGAPEWVKDLVHDAHGDMLPDDWRYACIRNAVDWIAEGNDPDESSEFADSEVDAYTGARLEWLASHGSRTDYVDDAVAEFGYDPTSGIVHAIGVGQYMEASEVFGLVLNALQEQVDELEAAETFGD